ncbi:uncharacterized protein LOC131881260 isoform X1 [Tigriopus californicus]|uniref:uncharacterized protein LOC131881260 isoform X1 n=1 Tax=Tigriopus californicus TaxID=6832 RepID=UPI0027DA4341|nr:uncharacterized protein LOC131881260 isoform X1 [Tigriopus californicus]
MALSIRLNISFGGPQKVEVFGDVAAVLEMNIVVHGSHGILYMFPTTYAPQQPILNLFLRPDGVDCIAHISVIKYMSLFEKTMKKRCYFCRSVFHYRSTHSCEKSKPCLKCKRPILLEDYFNGPSMKNTYCPSTLTESNWELKCQHCGQEFQSRNCLEVHTKSCRHTLYFTCCNRQLRVRGKSPIELRAIHDCSKNFCPSPEIVQRGNKEDHWCEERQQDKMLISCAEYFHLKRVEEAHQKCQRKIEDKKKQ